MSSTATLDLWNSIPIWGWVLIILVLALINLVIFLLLVEPSCSSSTQENRELSSANIEKPKQ